MPTQVRIGIDARPLSDQLCGIGHYLKNLLDRLKSIDTFNQYYLFSNRRIDYDTNASLSWHKIEDRFERKLLGTIWSQTVFPIRIKKLNIDLLWSPRHHLPLIRSSRIKTVLTIHDLVHRLYPETMSLPNLMVEKTLMNRSIRRADRIVAVSHSTASDLMKCHPRCRGKTRVVQNGTPPWTEDAAGKDDPASPKTLQRYFLFVGTIEPRKNLYRLLRAYEQANFSSPDCHLMIVGGKGWKNHALRKRLEEHPLKNRIHLTGYLPRSHLKAVYQRAICLVFPSIYEGFGLPILEAMKCGTPVITSNVSSMPEVAGDAALLVDPYDTDQLARNMIRLSRDDRLRKELIGKGYRRAMDFSWDRAACEMLKIFAEIGSVP